MASDQIKYLHCDVFTDTPFAGNSLAIFPDADHLNSIQMLLLTQELRHFESVFVQKQAGQTSLRIFDQFEELRFAGHPVMGAAAMLHNAMGDREQTHSFGLYGNRRIQVRSKREGQAIRVTMDQGQPSFIKTVPKDRRTELAHAFGLTLEDLAPLPMETITNGLAYLIMPLRRGLEVAYPRAPDLGPLLHVWGADFAYLLDVHDFEGRTWTNKGSIEDVATGSAGGPVAAYAIKHRLMRAKDTLVLQQGRFLGRPSRIRATSRASGVGVGRMEIEGSVAFVGSGSLVYPPDRLPTD